jgi:hypothetical protein
VRNGAEEFPDVVDEEPRVLQRGKCPPCGIGRPATALFRDARPILELPFAALEVAPSVRRRLCNRTPRTGRFRSRSGLSVILRVIATELAATRSRSLKAVAKRSQSQATLTKCVSKARKESASRRKTNSGTPAATHTLGARSFGWFRRGLPPQGWGMTFRVHSSYRPGRSTRARVLSTKP